MTIMNISKLLTDEAVLAETGNRIARYRIDSQVTQADLAEQAGVSKRTVERVEVRCLVGLLVVRRAAESVVGDIEMHELFREAVENFSQELDERDQRILDERVLAEEPRRIYPAHGPLIEDGQDTPVASMISSITPERLILNALSLRSPVTKTWPESSVATPQVPSNVFPAPSPSACSSWSSRSCCRAWSPPSC